MSHNINNYPYYSENVPSSQNIEHIFSRHHTLNEGATALEVASTLERVDRDLYRFEEQKFQEYLTKAVREEDYSKTEPDDLEYTTDRIGIHIAGSKRSSTLDIKKRKFDKNEESSTRSNTSHIDASPVSVGSSNCSVKDASTKRICTSLKEDNQPFPKTIWTEEDHSQLLAELRNYAIKWKINRRIIQKGTSCDSSEENNIFLRAIRRFAEDWKTQQMLSVSDSTNRKFQTEIMKKNDHGNSTENDRRENKEFMNKEMFHPEYVPSSSFIDFTPSITNRNAKRKIQQGKNQSLLNVQAKVHTWPKMYHEVLLKQLRVLGIKWKEERKKLYKNNDYCLVDEQHILNAVLGDYAAKWKAEQLRERSVNHLL